jgi:tetratricopeptide (TPR) repeat protein
LNICIEIGDRSGEGIAYGNLGNAYNSLGDFKKAIEYHTENLNICIDIGDRSAEEKAYFNLGMNSYLLNNGVDAAKFFESAIQCCNEIMQLLLNTHELESFYLENVKNYYKRVENVLISQGNYNRSLEVSEEGRTRGFVDQIYNNILFSNEKSPSINIDDIYSITTNVTLIEYSSNKEYYYNSGEIK